MLSITEELEREILRALKSAHQQGRLDVAEFMLEALEKLDRDRIQSEGCDCQLTLGDMTKSHSFRKN